jgi:putative transposase
MKSQTVAQLLAALGIIKSQSRPHVSNDNSFSESQFKTLKYRPEFPERFASHDEARAFCVKFFAWYNDEHYHSGLQMFTPASVHFGRTQPILIQRAATLQAAFAAHPERFVHGQPKTKPTPSKVWINQPERAAT